MCGFRIQLLLARSVSFKEKLPTHLEKLNTNLEQQEVTKDLKLTIKQTWARYLQTSNNLVLQV